MKFIYSTYEHLKKLAPAVEFVEAEPDSQQMIAETFGAILPVFVNGRTKHLLTPITASALQNTGQIPCIVLDIPEEDELGVAIILNGGIEGNLYNVPADTAALLPYLRRLYAENRKALLALGQSPEYWREFFQWVESSPLPYEQPRPAVLDLEIPQLDLAMQADTIPVDIAAWNAHARKRQPASAYHFYVDDFRFSALAKNPLQFVQTGARVAVEPNFTTHENQPGALFVYDLYRKRAMAQSWQEQGVKIVVDLNVARRYLPLALEGVPRGWRVYANRAYGDDLDHLHEAYAMAANHAVKPVIYAVVGNLRVREICQQNGWHWIDSGLTRDGRGYGQSGSKNQAV